MRALLTIAGASVFLGFMMLLRGASPSPEAAESCQATPPKDALEGLWSRYEPGGLGAPVRFYYFHGDGNGLYRYGKVGYTNTNSYNYEVKGDQLELCFRKTGVCHNVKFKIEQDKNAGREWLTIEGDPREPGARYYRQRDPVSVDGAPLSFEVQPDDKKERVDGYMWIEQLKYKTGGMGFAIYQFKEAGIDGRGTGWFHQGDFNDWSTESLTYRLYQNKMELWFDLREETATTSFLLSGKDKEARLSLGEDPRNFWLSRTFIKMGKSF